MTTPQVTRSDLLLSTEPPEEQSAEDAQLIENFRAVEKLLLKLVPTETALLILDYAEFWCKQQFIRSGRAVFGSIDMLECSMLYLQTAPIGYGGQLDSIPVLKPRKVIFEMQSWTNGIGNSNTGTYAFKPDYHVSWFDVSIFRKNPKITGKDLDPKAFDPYGLTDTPFPNPDDEQLDRLPSWLYDKDQLKGGVMVVQNGLKNRWWLQGTKLAGEQDAYLTYEIVWTADVTEQSIPIYETGRGDGEGFVEQLRRGDRIAVWARSVSEEHFVRLVKTEIYFAMAE